MTVKRYNAGCAYAGEEEMVQVDDGAYVNHEDYPALLKERDALAAENAGLRRFISGSCYVFDGDHDDDMPDEFVDASNYMPIVTPAIDAAIASIKADGVESFGDELLSDLRGDCWDEHDIKYIEMQISCHLDELRKEHTHD